MAHGVLCVAEDRVLCVAQDTSFYPFPNPFVTEKAFSSYQYRSIPGTYLATHPSENSSLEREARESRGAQNASVAAVVLFGEARVEV